MSLNCNVNSIWFLLLFIKIIKPVNLQFGMPIYPPPMFPPAPVFPAPMPMLPIAMVTASSSSSEENDKTTKKPKKKIIKMLYPEFPKLTCKLSKPKKNETKKIAYPVPIPMPPMVAPPPPPLVLVPVPPAIPAQPMLPRRRPKMSSSDESTDSSSSYENFRRRKRRRWYRPRKRANIYRRNLRSSESDDELLKPMLRFLADNGDVKFEAKINKDDIAQLLGKKGQKLNKRLQTMKGLSKEEVSHKPRVIVASKDEESGRNLSGRRTQVLFRDGLSNPLFSNGKKEIILRPPIDKTISNLSVSFHIS